MSSEMTIPGHDAIVQTLTARIEASRVCAWNKLDQSWQTKICRAIAPNRKIACLVTPHTVAELSYVLTCAHDSGWHVLPCGSGSKLDWGGIVAEERGKRKKEKGKRDSTQHSALSTSPLPTPLIALSTDRLNHLIDHAVGDLTVTVEVGIRFADLQATLARAGQFLAIDPTYPEQATIGGIVATADTGSLRQRYHSVRDMLLGISFVRADGQIAKAGGRVVKNVAGYDLMKLFTGSFGTLGVLTEMTFRVYPLPETSQTIVLTGAADAIASLTKTLLSSALTPTRMDVLSAAIVAELGLGNDIGLAVQFGSIASSVQEQISRVAELGRSLGLQQIQLIAADDAALWARLQTHTIGRDSEDTITGKIGVQPSEIVPFLQAIDQFPHTFAQIHALSGLGKLSLPAQPDTLLKIRRLCQDRNGFLSLLQAPITLKREVDVWGYSGNSLEIMRKIKLAFDPHNTLSPDRFVGGI